MRELESFLLLDTRDMIIINGEFNIHVNKANDKATQFYCYCRKL